MALNAHGIEGLAFGQHVAILGVNASNQIE
jgi:hypothetical protein